MFKYQNFPIIKKDFYDHKGQLKRKSFRMKSVQPIFECSDFFLMNIIDIETSQNLTLKQIYKNQNLSKSKTLNQIHNQQTMNFHSNFMNLEQVFQDKQNVYLVMEENGANLQEILQSRKFFLEREVQYIFCQLITILENLRKHNIAHGQITLHQLYLNPNTMKIKLSGFYKSLNIQKEEKHNFNNKFQSTGYTSPELLNNCQIENYYMNDIWAVGVILFTLLTGKSPFADEEDQKTGISKEVKRKIRNCSFQFPSTPQVTRPWKELIKRIFQPKNKRITLKELIWHPLNKITQTWWNQLDKGMPPTIDHNFLENHDYAEGRKNTFPLYDQTWNINFKKINKTVVKSKSKKKQVRFEDTSPPSFYSLGDNSISEASETKIHDLIQMRKQKQYEKKSLVLSSPKTIQRYSLDEQNKCLGYLLNNAIGILFSDGTYLIGKNENDYIYNDSEIEETSCAHILLGSHKSLTRSYSRIKGNFPEKKKNIFKEYLNLFGERVGQSQFSQWVVKFWIIDHITIFLRNTDTWQLNFDQGRQFGIVLIDKNDLGWWYAPQSQKVDNSNLVKIARSIVRNIKIKLIRQQQLDK